MIADCGFEGGGTMSDTWTDRLSEYIDGTLPEAERTALEAHLAGCAACGTTLDELRRVVARARALDDRPPASDLWPAIAEQIGVSSGAHHVVSLAERRTRRETRSEEHTSELQSQSNLVCRLLLEKKKKKVHSLKPEIRR